MEEWEATTDEGGKWKRTDAVEIRKETEERNWEKTTGIKEGELKRREEPVCGEWTSMKGREEVAWRMR